MLHWHSRSARKFIEVPQAHYLRPPLNKTQKSHELTPITQVKYLRIRRRSIRDCRRTSLARFSRALAERLCQTDLASASCCRGSPLQPPRRHRRRACPMGADTNAQADAAARHLSARTWSGFRTSQQCTTSGARVTWPQHDRTVTPCPEVSWGGGGRGMRIHEERIRMNWGARVTMTPIEQDRHICQSLGVIGMLNLCDKDHGSCPKKCPGCNGRAAADRAPCQRECSCRRSHRALGSQPSLGEAGTPFKLETLSRRPPFLCHLRLPARATLLPRFRQSSWPTKSEPSVGTCERAAK